MGTGPLILAIQIRARLILSGEMAEIIYTKDAMGAVFEQSILNGVKNDLVGVDLSRSCTIVSHPCQKDIFQRSGYNLVRYVVPSDAGKSFDDPQATKWLDRVDFPLDTVRIETPRGVALIKNLHVDDWWKEIDAINSAQAGGSTAGNPT